MVAYDGSGSGDDRGGKTLKQLLAEVLPTGATFGLYHVSTPPTSTSAIYSAPPGERPDRTYCESHFLAVSAYPKGNATSSEASDEVLVFAIEILIYSTAYSTTLFVSKADSSGYLYLLNLPKGGPSPLKEISSTFLAYLVERRRRPGIPTIVSLFARAQDQYLFARSIHNKRKHVLDDRGLVKWWCRILDPLLDDRERKNWQHIHGYLTVPGLDKYEAKSFLPPLSVTKNWSVGHPLKEISRFADAPPRCLIPHFPDDPKSRFLDELDDELSGSQGKDNGQWKSVKSLDTFWELMAFRQECSAGRLVGFIWVVFTPKSPKEIPPLDSQLSSTSTLAEDDSHAELPRSSRRGVSPGTSVAPSTGSGPPVKIRRRPISEQSPRKVAKKRALSGPIIPRQPRVKTHNRKQKATKPEITPYYIWPGDSRGQVVLEEKDYRRFHELLLCLDFANVNLAQEATKRWTSEVLAGPQVEAQHWGTTVVGTKEPVAKAAAGTDGVRTLSLGLVRKKRKGEGEAAAAGASAVEAKAETPQVNILGAGMVRKKAKK